MDIKTKVYVTKIFDNKLVAIRKNKVTLMLNKHAYIGMYILELSKKIMYEFHYYYIKNRYGNNPRILFTVTDSLMYEIKIENIYEDFNNNKKMFDFSNYSTKSKYYKDSNKLVIHEMKDETSGVGIEKFFGLKTTMYSFLVDDNSDHKKVKGLNRGVVVTISHNEYKDVLLNNKYLRHLTNRIQIKNHKIGTYKIDKISLFCFDDKIYIQDNVRINYQSYQTKL